MKVFVTGASGFLGRALLARWVTVGHEVVGLVRNTSSLAKLAPLAGNARLHTAAGDQDLRSLLEHFRPDVVAHTACAYGRSGESPLSLLDANVRLGVLLLQAAVANGRPCLFLNTGTALSPRTGAYALSKHHFSDWARQIAAAPDNGEVKLVDLRLEYMFGPGDSESKFPAHVMNTCRRNDPELRLTGCEQRRDFIYIDDVVDAYDHLVSRADSLAHIEQVPLGSGQAVTLRSFVETVHALTQSQTVLRFGALPYRLGEEPEYCADVTRFNQLGWHPRFDLRAGLLDWLARADTPNKSAGRAL